MFCGINKIIKILNLLLHATEIHRYICFSAVHISSPRTVSTDSYPTVSSQHFRFRF